MRYLARLIGLIILVVCSSSFAGGEREVQGAEPVSPLLQQTPIILDANVPGYLARIELDNPAAVEAALRHAEQAYLSDEIPEGIPPVVFVLHGPEVSVFQKSNYKRYKSLVDLAARLSAFEVVDIRICETRMSMRNEKAAGLYPFVGTVPLGPREVKRLVEVEQYIYF